ncbi:MAG: hypothetical protein WEE89_23220 [Gemmatimonadota bacterium]
MAARDEPAGESVNATIGRLDAERLRWRVVVEAWPAAQSYHGRLVFLPEAMPGQPAFESAPRQSGALLHGRTAEEIVIAAHELPEKHIRALLHSLA